MLVTGGAGFIGSFVVDALVEAGGDVVVIDNLAPWAHVALPDYLNPAARYLWRDVRDAAAWREALAGVDVVCHQAGKVGLGVDFADSEDFVLHNDLGWAVGLGVLHEVGFRGRVVLASSMVVYGEGGYRCAREGSVRPGPRLVADLDAGRFEPRCPDCGGELEGEPIPESAPTDPRNVYAATKLHQEHLLAAFAREHAIDACWLRYHNVYGPRMPRDTPYAGVASVFRSALENGFAPQVNEDGRQRRDFVHVRDVAQVNVAALLGDEPLRGSVNVGSGTPHTVLEMAEALAAAYGARSGDERWPRVTGAYRLGDVRHVFAATALAHDLYGLRPSVSFADGMTELATTSFRDSVAPRRL